MPSRARIPAAVLLLALARTVAAAEETPLPERVTATLAPIISEYGIDAVNLNGNLLRHAIQAGSTLEASVGITGIRDRDGVRYLDIELDTGIVFRDDVPPLRRVRRIWVKVVEPSLHLCRRFEVAAEGLQVRASYRHGSFTDRADLARQAREGLLPVESATFALRKLDVVERASDRISAQDLAARTSVLLDGIPLEGGIPVK